VPLSGLESDLLLVMGLRVEMGDGVGSRAEGRMEKIPLPIVDACCCCFGSPPLHGSISALALLPCFCVHIWLDLRFSSKKKRISPTK
jgi:hypothetical protein